MKDRYYARLRLIKRVATFQNLTPEVAETLELDDNEFAVISEVWNLLPDIASDGDLAYHVVVEPLTFLPAYCQLSALFEHHGFPQFSATPLRRTLIPPHVVIDTKILICHVLGISRTAENGLTDAGRRALWGQVFDLESPAFRERKQKGLSFEWMISTDGVAVSVHLKNPNLSYGHKAKKKSKELLRNEVRATYFQHHLDHIRRFGNVVVVDPNYRDILFCRHIHTNETLRYTSNQRAHETGTRRYRKKREKMKEGAHIPPIESNIPTHKTMVFSSFCAYLTSVRNAEPQLKPFYADITHRKMRWNTFVNTQRSESSLIKRMRKTFGKKLTIVMGDWNESGRAMRYQVSTKTKGWRKIFARNRIPCYLLDEYRTSSVCECGTDVVKDFKKRDHARPWRKAQGKEQKVHGLLGMFCVIHNMRSFPRLIVFLPPQVAPTQIVYSKDGLTASGTATLSVPWQCPRLSSRISVERVDHFFTSGVSIGSGSLADHSALALLQGVHASLAGSNRFH